MKIVFIITLIVCFVGFTSLLYAEDNATVSIEDKSSESTENTSSTIEDDDFFDNPLPEVDNEEDDLTISSKAMFGIEIGYLNFESSTKHIDKVNNRERTIVSTGRGQDISLVYVFENSNFMWKIGVISFSEEPIASANEMGYSEDIWSPKSESITHTEIGYNFNFNKNEGFYFSIFGDIGIYSYEYKNQNLENLADSSDYLMYIDDFKGDTFDSNTQSEDMETNSDFFLDFGAALNYEVKNFKFQIIGKMNTMEVKKYEGIYYVGSSIWGATATKMHGFEHEITIVPSIYFSFAYKF